MAPNVKRLHRSPTLELLPRRRPSKSPSVALAAAPHKPLPHPDPGVQREATGEAGDKQDDAREADPFKIAVTARNIMKVESTCSKIIEKQLKALLDMDVWQ